jgi:hypothetical protein
MRTAILCLLLIATATVALAGTAQTHAFPAHLGLRDLVGLLSFGALGGMLLWHLRK